MSQLQSSQQNTHRVGAAGEPDDGGKSSSDDDLDDPDYKPPASSHHTRPPEGSDSYVEEPVARSQCLVASRPFDSIDSISTRRSVVSGPPVLFPPSDIPPVASL